MLVELSEQVLWPLDGAGHQLRVEHHVESIVAEVPFRLLVAAIDLNDVAQALERVEGEADGQGDVQDFLRVCPSEMLGEGH